MTIFSPFSILRLIFFSVGLSSDSYLKEKLENSIVIRH
ncbi:hypothetical protein D020_2508 [Vibrio parahaemolyticus SBR10290]|nr:hypothetical protein D042_4741 [Vibrio parahaemolyticus NIHCB0757]ETX54539.1 hypothetical protein D020_2508 [Vibrio parahaemolyticus SBR10290]